MQGALWSAVLQSAALRSSTERERAVDAAVAAASGTHDTRYLSDALHGLTSSTATVARVPSTTRVAEGQFAFVPDPAAIVRGMAQALNPGGAALIHEYYDYASWRMAPPSRPA